MSFSIASLRKRRLNWFPSEWKGKRLENVIQLKLSFNYFTICNHICLELNK
jgi:hypothetical protein